MAVNNLKNYKDADGFGMTLNIRRGEPNPLDNTSLWDSLEKAQNYAKTNVVAYVGQILTVIENGQVNNYYIANENGDLIEILDKQNIEWQSF